MKKAILSLLPALLCALLCGCERGRSGEWEQIVPAEETLSAAVQTTAAPSPQEETGTVVTTEGTAVSKTAETPTESTVRTTSAVTAAARQPKTSVKQTAIPSAATTAFSVEREIQEVLRLTNKYRRTVLASGLTLDAALCRAADLRARECVAIHDIDHVRPDGRDCQTVLDDFGIDFLFMGENLAVGQVSAEDVCRQWKASPDHYRNMVDRDFHKLGVGLAADENGYGYWVQLFSD